MPYAYNTVVTSFRKSQQLWRTAWGIYKNERNTNIQRGAGLMGPAPSTGANSNLVLQEERSQLSSVMQLLLSHSHSSGQIHTHAAAGTMIKPSETPTKSPTKQKDRKLGQGLGGQKRSFERAWRKARKRASKNKITCFIRKAT